MKIVIECDCGNKLVEEVPTRKYMQLRDNLQRHQFSYEGEEIKDGKLKEIRIKCEKCKNWIILGLD